MEVSSPILLEISSDEEAEFGDAKRGGGGGGFDGGDDHDWLSELLGEVDGRNKHDDSDDLVLIGEVFSNTVKESRLSTEMSAKVVDDDDDDCVILDGDPDKPVSMENVRSAAAGGAADDDDENSDDLKIVGEKGEVACRDFPHARHLCAKFPFASTAHEVHCGQCHCYVCDSLAPCAHWGTGFSKIDHCHASDKEEFWRAERKSRSIGRKPVQAFPTTSNTSFLAGLQQKTQVSALAQPQSNALLPNQFLRPITMRLCSMSSNANAPTSVNPGRHILPQCNVPTYKSKSPSVSPQLLNTCNGTVTSRNKSYRPENRSSQLFPPHAVFKKSGFSRASPNNRRGYLKRYSGIQLFKEPAENRSYVSQPPALHRNHPSIARNIGCRVVNSEFTQAKLSAPSSMYVRCANNIPSQPQRHGQPISSCLSSDQVNESHMPSQSYLYSDFVNVPPFIPQGASQSNAGNFKKMVHSQPDLRYRTNCSVSSPTLSSQSYSGNALENQMHTEIIMSSHPNMGSTFENQSTQHHAYSDSSSLVINGQHDAKQGGQTQTDLDTNLEDLGFAFDASSSIGNLLAPLDMYQLESAEPADNTQNQSVEEHGNHQSIAQVDNFHQQSFVHADSFSHLDATDCNLSTHPDILDFHFDSSMFETQSLPGAFEVPLSPPWM